MKRMILPALVALTVGGCASYAATDYTYGYPYGYPDGYYAEPYYGYYDAPSVTVFPSVVVGGYWRDGSYWRDGRAWHDERHWRESNRWREENRWRGSRHDGDRQGGYGSPQRSLQGYAPPGQPGAYEPGRDGWTSEGAAQMGR